VRAVCMCLCVYVFEICGCEVRLVRAVCMCVYLCVFEMCGCEMRLVRAVFLYVCVRCVAVNTLFKYLMLHSLRLRLHPVFIHVPECMCVCVCARFRVCVFVSNARL
jgi:hypothetical protein